MSEITIELFQRGNGEHKRLFDALNREWLTEYFRVEDTDEAMFTDPEGMILGHDGLILFGSVDGKILGTGALLAHEPGVYELAKMGVSGRARGKGVGRKVAEALVAAAREKKAHKLYIASNRKLEAALALYYSLGFKEVQGADSRYERCDITLEMKLEIGGRGGLDPTRYGDWEIAGKCVDF